MKIIKTAIRVASTNQSKRTDIRVRLQFEHARASYQQNCIVQNRPIAN